MQSIKPVNAAPLLFLTVVGGLIAVNYSLPFPDSNDYQGLARICLLMDENVRYCVNNNWGFAHPLSCLLMTKITGDLLVSQRLLNALFTLLYIVLLLQMMRRFVGRLSSGYVGCLLLFIFSPWFFDAALSVHMDIIPITLMFAAVSVVIHRWGAAALLAAGVLAGASYWFRFHFLTMSLLFPLLAGALVTDRRKRKKGFLLSAAGVIVTVALPHLLCMRAYGVFGISNQRFVLAQALGAVDWTYESAVRLSRMTTAEMFASFDPLRFVLSYGYHFITGGLFALLLIVVFSFRNYFREKRETFQEFFTGSDSRRAMMLIALWAGIAVIPFTVVRGFTLRLESAFVFFAIPLVVGTITGASKKVATIALILLLSGMAVPQMRFWRGFHAEKTSIVVTGRIVAQTIPDDVLRNRPGSIINCVNYYNPYNKYHLCNPMVFAGWGVRFGPFIDRFGLLNFADPFDAIVYKKADYLILPTHPEADIFGYPGELITRNRTLFENEDITILRKKTGG